MGCNEHIIKQARCLYRKYGIRDPFRIAESLGIRIKYTDLLHQLKGMYTVVNRQRVIVLNNSNKASMNRIVCAHELGHDQIHREYAKDTVMQEFILYEMSNRLEYEANIFAAALLLDDDEVLDMIDRGYDAVQIATATRSDVNLVALKVDSLIQDGYRLRRQDHNSTFLK